MWNSWRQKLFKRLSSSMNLSCMAGNWRYFITLFLPKKWDCYLWLSVEIMRTFRFCLKGQICQGWSNTEVDASTLTWAAFEGHMCRLTCTLLMAMGKFFLGSIFSWHCHWTRIGLIALLGLLFFFSLPLWLNLPCVQEGSQVQETSPIHALLLETRKIIWSSVSCIILVEGCMHLSVRTFILYYSCLRE